MSAILLLLAAAGTLLFAQQQPAPAAKIEAQDVVAFLNQSIGWYRGLSSEQQLANEPSDVLYLNDNHALADQIVRQSFDFALVEAELLPKQATATDQAQSDGNARLMDLATRAEQQVKRSQDELESLRQKLVTATGKQRQALESAIAETQSEVELAKTRRDAMRSMVEFVNGKNGSGLGSGGLHAQIEELERTVPAAAANGTASTDHAKASTATIATTRPAQPAGILALITDLISLSRKLHALDLDIEATDALAQASKSMRSPMGAGLRELAQRGDQLANQPSSNDPAVLAQQKAQLDELTAQFKQRSDAILPLVKQRVLLDLYKRSLTNWRGAVKEQYTNELKSLIVRLAVLAVVLALVVGFSQLWRKGIFRYVHDTRRRYQLMLFRRIVVWLFVIIIVAFAFAAELGSLATFAGLMTAGVAVALQNVILSVAGYFFLIGKYGVRVGDRVQINGVTGEVVDIGLVRLHMMELGGGTTDAQPTGRVVVFSNSVVFQPNNGLFKQIPGTNFVWHEIRLLLTPESDYRSVEERIVSAVQTVFNEYRDHMERQRRHAEKTLSSVSIRSLGPQSRLRLTQSGLEVVIRYPLELENAAEVDDHVTREVLDAIEREPKLKLVGSGTPNIQPVCEPAEVLGK